MIHLSPESEVVVDLLLSMTGQKEVFYPKPKWRRSYLVKDKYVPRRGRGAFLVFLEGKDGPCHSLVDVSYYGDFDVSDVIRFGRSNPRKPDEDGWLTIQGDFDVVRASPKIERLTCDVGYISNPRRIGDAGVFFFSSIGPQKWLKIPYTVAQDFFEHGPKGGRGRDYYQVLGVARSANGGDVQKAYRGLVKRYHHDGGTHPDEKIMQRINEAYDVLSDPGARQRYDAIRCGGPTLSGWPGQGAGRLEVLGEDRGSLFSVTTILSFARETRKEVIVFSVNNPPHAPLIGILSGGRTLDLVWEGEEISQSQRNEFTGASSFEVENPVYPDIPTEVQAEIEYRKRAHWDNKRGRKWFTWDIRNVRVLGVGPERS